MDLDGKPLALLLMGKSDDGEDDWAVFPGTFRQAESSQYLDRGPERENFEIRVEWFESNQSRR